jgi:hypothetical protein
MNCLHLQYSSVSPIVSRVCVRLLEVPCRGLGACIVLIVLVHYLYVGLCHFCDSWTLMRLDLAVGGVVAGINANLEIPSCCREHGASSSSRTRLSRRMSSNLGAELSVLIAVRVRAVVACSADNSDNKRRDVHLNMQFEHVNKRVELYVTIPVRFRRFGINEDRTYMKPLPIDMLPMRMRSKLIEMKIMMKLYRIRGWYLVRPLAISLIRIR